ncbi:NACHT, LRR and PYD domains-containing protein 3-like isoform X6 [Anguilla rostrata]|uniref:NACHT, LRR and PYD domains-containing protein 3-like isoform X6 n=1 Tax=Anguilla rostrata TaxID=7938 RepID=UPI0030CEA208
MSLSGEPENKGETHSTDRKRVQVERPGSPAPSYVSVKSESSMDFPFNLKGESTGDQRVQVERSGSPAPSYVSVKSESSMDYPFNLKGESTGDQRIHQSLDSSCFDDKTSQLFFPKQSLLRTLMKLNKDDKLKLFENHLSQDCPECFESLSEDPCAVDKFMMSELLKSHKIHDYPECIEREPEDPEALYIVEKMLETCGSERSLKITLRILRNMKEKDLANSLEREQRNEFIKRAQQALKTHLKRKFECIYDGLNHPALLNEIYTDLYITEGGSEGVNDEHEIRQIETASKRQTTQETAILCNDIFKPLPGQEKPRTVLTKGIAGIGKTVSVQKFILDWAEGKANQDIDFVFTLPFRDLNLKKETAFSLMQLLQHYFPQLKEIKTFEGDEVKVLFIFDGLDECRLPLNFQSNKICCDMTKVLSVDVLLTNLIKGNLFPSALLWITSRPAAANQIPLECVHQVTEVRGFSDPQKEEYFRKRIRDEKQASRIISHIRSSRSLYIMCHIPVFCWISAAVLETMLGETESGDLPRTLTEMYTHFLLIQTHVKNQKYHGTIGTNPKKMSESDREIILKLGQLAFVQLVKGNLIFYEEDLRESGIDVTEASVYSGVCTEIFKEEYGLYQEKVFCFVHLSIQEYLAALFAFYSCVNENINVLRTEESKPHGDRVQMSELHRSAVDQALESKNGQLDFFLRFLLGLSLDSVKTLLGELLTQTISRSSVPGLQTQTGSRSSVPGLQTQTGSRSSGPDPQTGIRSPLPGPKTQTKCRSSVSDLQTQTVRRSSVPDLQTQTGRRTPGPDAQAQTESRSENIEETVKYIKKKISEESSAERIINLFRCLSELNDNTLVEEIQNCLRSRKLLDKVLELHQCSALAFVLLMSEEVLAEFDLKTYNTTAAGHQRLVPVVRNCRKAILNRCDLTQKSCDIVASALQSSSSTLRDLDLSYNDLGDAGVKLLCTGLMSPKCNLQRLGLNSCDLTEESCDIVASALQSSSSPLRDLDLSYNDLGDSGVKLLCAGLLSPKCKLERLGLISCDLTQKSCDIVASALQSSSSPLRDLDLSYNNLGDAGVKSLCAGLMSPKCKLQRLGLGWCNLTEGCCDILASVLCSPHSELRDLELRDNELQDSGVRALSAGLEDPHCKLQRLGLSGCRVTQRGFDSLASAVCSNPSHLRELDLSYNHPIFSKLRALLSTKLDTLTLLADCRGGHRTKPGPRKYGCQLTLDPNTAYRELSLSEGNRKVTHTLGREQPYPDHPERFEPVPQVMCREFLYERCYWKTEFSVSEEGQVDIVVAYEGISRKIGFSDCRLGWNKNSWSLECNKRRYSVRHNKTQRQILARPSPYRRAGVCDDDDGTIREVCVYRVGVCVDRPSGTLSFYSISNSDTLTLLHRFHVQFTQRTPLCAGFYVYKSSVSLCQLQ